MTYLVVGDSFPKGEVIPHKLVGIETYEGSLRVQLAGLAAHQVVGGVMAYQADDG